MGLAAGEQVVPEDVGVREAVHQLHLPQHVAPVAGQLVHLQHHDLPRLAVPHLEGDAGQAEPHLPLQPPQTPGFTWLPPQPQREVLSILCAQGIWHPRDHEGEGGTLPIISKHSQY